MNGGSVKTGLWVWIISAIYPFLCVPYGAVKALRMHQPWAMQPMGLYIHIPFCRRRCYYCDFPIVVAGESKSRQAQMSGEYAQLLKKEIFAFSQAIDSIKESFIIDSVYLGGGTPSLALDEGKSQS